MKMTLEELRGAAKLFAGNGLNRIYLHWSAGYYDQLFVTDYHISIMSDGAIYFNHFLTEKLAHTWRRNTNAVGVSMMCAFGAKCYTDPLTLDMGNYPPTAQQIEAMARIICVLSDELDIPIDETHVMTHHECAVEDKYSIYDDDPDCRWDLIKLTDSDGTLKDGGFVLRGKALWYQNNEKA